MLQGTIYVRRRLADIDVSSPSASLFIDATSSLPAADGTVSGVDGKAVETDPQTMLAHLRDDILPTVLPQDCCLDYTVPWIAPEPGGPKGMRGSFCGDHTVHLAVNSPVSN